MVAKSTRWSIQLIVLEGLSRTCVRALGPQAWPQAIKQWTEHAVTDHDHEPLWLVSSTIQRDQRETQDADSSYNVANTLHTVAAFIQAIIRCWEMLAFISCQSAPYPHCSSLLLSSLLYSVCSLSVCPRQLPSPPPPHHHTYFNFNPNISLSFMSDRALGLLLLYLCFSRLTHISSFYFSSSFSSKN